MKEEIKQKAIEAEKELSNTLMCHTHPLTVKLTELFSLIRNLE